MQQQLEALHAFIAAQPEKSIDFSPAGPTPGAALVPADKLPQLKVLGQNAAGCLVVAWKEKETDDFYTNAPIAWMDSEGSPAAVFAASLAEFFQLLYFDTGFVFDVLSKLERKQAVKPMNAKDLDNYISDCYDYYPGYKAFTEFLQNDLKTAQPAHPDAIIQQAYNAHPGFSAWLGAVK